MPVRTTGLSRMEELLEEFLANTAEARDRFLHVRPKVSEELRRATEAMLADVAEGRSVEPAGLLEIPRKALQQMHAGDEFYCLWEGKPPPELAVVGNEPVVPERRRQVLALLQMGVGCETRQEGVEVLDRLLEASQGIPGLGFDFSCWLYLLAPTVFPPLPGELFSGAGEVLAGVSGLKDTVRRVWAFADRHAPLLQTDDLAVPAAFFEWLCTQGAEVWARPKAKGPYYGAELLVSETLLSATFVERLLRELQSRKQLLFTGPSGTGKTYSALRFVRYLVRDGGASELLRAHAGLGYREMVGYPPTPGVLIRLAEAASRDPAGAYVLYLDAIDRLDVDRVLGDLVLAFEYPEEEVTTAGGFKFRLPPNLYILATAQRSWEELLKGCYGVYRIFAHARFSPDPLELAEFFNRQDNPIKKIDLVHVFRKLNRMLHELSGGSEVSPQMGHGYLMVSGLNDSNLGSFWDSHVVPYIKTLLSDPRIDYDVFRLHRLG